jgi:hypothetical protein
VFGISSSRGDARGPAPHGGRERADPLEAEARRLLDAAGAQDVPLRLLGGMGIRVLLGERLAPELAREIEDLDFITTRRAGRAVERLLAAQGWEPQRRFNALHGAQRLLFEGPDTRRIDVFVGDFRMCHALPLAERIDAWEETLPAAELLLSKLQIVALNAKDRGDLYALLLGCEVAESDAQPGAPGEPPRAAICARRVAALTAGDWGLSHTVELNFARLREGLAQTALAAAQRERVQGRIDALADAIERAPKSRAWRLRARVGERRRWYEDPEEIAR